MRSTRSEITKSRKSLSVHGWKHNADQDDLDLGKFKELISELDMQQRQLDEQESRRVVGVYVGWDGAVGPAPLQHLSFWNRKRAADRISQSSVVTKIISATKYAREQVGRGITARPPALFLSRDDRAGGSDRASQSRFRGFDLHGDAQCPSARL